MKKALLFSLFLMGITLSVAAQGSSSAASGKKQVDAQGAAQVQQGAAPAEETAEAVSNASALEQKADPAIAGDLQAAASAEEPGESFVTPRETVEEAPAPVQKELVVFRPKNPRDPTLSPDDFLLLQYREQQRLAAIEAERQRKLAEERRLQEEAERLRQLELARIKDPTREVRNRIKIGGIIGQEVFIGEKVYTVGNKIFGARIVEVTPDSVVFLYKGHKFVRKMQ